MNIALLLAVLLVSPSFADLISDEMVPIVLKEDALECYEKTEGDGGFRQPMPAEIVLRADSVIDRTLRVKNYHFYRTLPDSVSCASLRSELYATPLNLLVNRKVSRVVKSNPNNEDQYSFLVEDISIEVPVQLEGKNIVLHHKQGWLEENPYNPGRAFPKHSSYIAHTHPQSASAPVGLFCAPLYQGSTKYTLGFGHFTISSPAQASNLDVVTTSPFDTEALCLENKNQLIKRFKAEDPENWGSRLRVDRTIEFVNRYILDNQAKSMCQEILLETIFVSINGLNFSAVGASFPLRTVDLALCGARAGL
jgi:hypothetical protein